MDNLKLQKLKEYLQLMSDSLTRADFTAAFKLLMDSVVKLEQKLTQKIDDKTQDALNSFDELQKLYKETIKKVEEENQSSFSNMKRWAIEQVSALFIKYQIKEKIAEVDAKMAEINDYILPSADVIATEASKLASETLLPLIPKIEPIEEKLPQMGDIIATSLENLSEDEKLKIEAISGLKEKLDELEKKPARVGGGGFSYLAMDQHFVDDETPTGTPNGVLTTFTISHTPSPVASLKVFVNGQRLRLTEDYTFSGVTITFLTAPPTGSIILTDYRI